MKYIITIAITLSLLTMPASSKAQNFSNLKSVTISDVQEQTSKVGEAVNIVDQYTVGVNDILEISVIQPDKLSKTVTVSPDGFISFPYIGNVRVQGMSLSTIQRVVENQLADGYMKYPVVSVFLTESRSRKFFVYGEVNEPGSYPLEENTTILRAISMSGGFTKYGSSRKVRLMRTRKDQPGYEIVKVDIKAIMNGKTNMDLSLKSGDIIVVSDGSF